MSGTDRANHLDVRVRTQASPLERWVLAGFLFFTVTALAGYGLFGLRPHRLPEIGAVISFWSISFRFFAQAHVILGGVVLGVMLVLRTGWRWVGAAAAVYLISFLSEFIGTGYGFPFGEYGYTNLLGAKLGGRIPFVIPLSWFLMAFPSFVLASVTFPGREERLRRASFAVLLLLVWDLALDPAMSWSPPFYWTWGAEGGPYYGMPWMNLFGWALTGAVIMTALERLGALEWSRSLPVGWIAGYYGVTLLMPLGMILLEGLWLAVAVTMAGLLLCFGIHRVMVRSEGLTPDVLSPPSMEGS